MMIRQCPMCGAVLTREKFSDPFICGKCGWESEKKVDKGSQSDILMSD